jgi:hypothetical protein
MAPTRRKAALGMAVAALLVVSAACSWSQDRDDEAPVRPLIVVDSTVNTTEP